jgi:ribosomal protein S18 acetylase RimI-like enzyme
MPRISVVPCTEQDLGLLAIFNKQLIEDEQHENPMNIDQLKERMKEFISTDYKAFFFTEAGNIVGYALVNMKREPYYLRQFFIMREHRRKGCGRDSFHELLRYLKTSTIDIEVLSWNQTGRKFWESLGFKERSLYMRYAGGKTD